MKTLNKILLIVGIAFSACNNGSKPSTEQSDTTTIRDMPAETVTTAPATTLSTMVDPTKLGNIQCPVCHTPLSKCFDDTASYMDKLIGFDKQQCRIDFVKTPETYKVEYK